MEERRVELPVAVDSVRRCCVTMLCDAMTRVIQLAAVPSGQGGGMVFWDKKRRHLRCLWAVIQGSQSVGLYGLPHAKGRLVTGG